MYSFLTPLAAQIAHDRLEALARGVALPEESCGAALFADLSGFTPLSEALTGAFGDRRGVEELTGQLNRVYAALIAEVERYGGSVHGFSGDAITCWFDGDDGWRATACALALHAALAQLGPVALPGGGLVLLAIRVGIACGPVRRLLVGDARFQVLDVLAGATLERMARAEQAAQRGEIALSPELGLALAERALIGEWRDVGDAARFPIVSGLRALPPEQPWPALAQERLTPELLRPWLLPELYARVLRGQSEPQPELRPVTALFLGFEGLDYERDEGAAARLDAYLCWVQALVARHEGTLLQLTIGDKGSYLFITFGAFTVREGDAKRAVRVALELRAPPPECGPGGAIRVGISQGIMCVGAYGSASRRTYGALGDETNLAARLMQAAAPGEVLISGRVQAGLDDAFVCEVLPPLSVKGKRQPVPVARLLGMRERAHGPRYSNVLLGREAELAWLREALRPVFERCRGALIVLDGEAGLGKSRLLYELRRRLGEGGRLRWLACWPAERVSQPFALARALLYDYLACGSDLSVAEQQARLDGMLDELIAAALERATPDLALALEQARPFLTAAIGLRQAGSTYEQATPEARQAGVLKGLATLLRAESLRAPLLVQIDDAHLLDQAGRALLGVLAQESSAAPLALLLSGRSGDDGQALARHLALDPPPFELRLAPLPADALRALAAHLLAGACGESLAALLLAKTAGNPFFAEQMLLDLRERQLLAPDEQGAWQLVAEEDLELPSTLTALLIARLDRLPPPLCATAQTAAVLGQEFDLRVLAETHAAGEEVAAWVGRGYDEGLWAPVDERRWRFRHALLRDAAYQMQLHARRRELHARAGAAIEVLFAEALAGHVADLTYHFRQAEDAARECHYLELLGEQAYDISQFAEATSCLERALDLAAQERQTDADTRAARLSYRLGRAHARRGDQAMARRCFAESVGLALAAGDDLGAADAAFSLGELAYRQGGYDEARARFEQSLARYQAVGDIAGQGRALNQLGALFIALDDAPRALACFEQALALPPAASGRRR